MTADYFIACGMYAPNDDVKNAWQVIFDRFTTLTGMDRQLRRQLVFDHSETVLRDRHLLIGHSCGYPLMTQFRETLVPFCVPCFDVPGTDGKHYTSQFIVPAQSSIESLPQCRGKIVAINGSDSNSGMNLLRHALARMGARPHYFATTRFTGSHLASIEAVAENRAQLAAIDSVTYRLIGDQNPALIASVRVIGQSEQTCGLPLVMPLTRYSGQTKDTWVRALNQALDQVSAEVGNLLHLDRFESVDMDDYQSILDLENFAIESGYPELN